MRAPWQKPSFAVGLLAVVLIAGFVWHGELRVASAATTGGAPRAKDGPVVVRRDRTAVKSSTVECSGRVFDTRGFLRVGVECVPSRGAAVRTDGDGEFRFACQQGTSVDVLVRGETLRPRWLRSSPERPDPLLVLLEPRAPWDPEPQPPKESAELRGEGLVRTSDGKPLAGAFVTTVDGDIWARTDELGRYTLPLPSAAVTLLVHDCSETLRAGGHAVRSEPFVSPRERGSVPLPELVVAPAAAIRGLVRDPRGLPIEGVPVEVRGAGLVREVATGGGGAFRVAGLLPGRYAVRPFPWRGAIGAVTTVELERTAVDLELQLAGAEEVKLRVVDRVGSPVAGAYVASSIDGLRRGLGQADDAGYAAVPIGAGAEFSVRTATALAPCAVQRFEPEPPTLVVAVP